MTFRRWGIFLAVCFAVFLALELLAYFSGATTLSQSIWAWNDAIPVLGTIVSFSVGVLFGHLFVPRKIIVRETRTMPFFGEPHGVAFDAKSLKQAEADATRYTKKRPF